MMTVFGHTEIKNRGFRPRKSNGQKKNLKKM